MFYKISSLVNVLGVKLLIPVSVVVVLLLMAAPAGLPGNNAEAQGGSSEESATTSGSSNTVTAQWSDTPIQLSADELKAAEAGQAKSFRKGPRVEMVTAPTSGDPGVGIKPVRPRAKASPDAVRVWNSLSFYRNSIIPGSAIAGGYGYSSYTMEPSTGANGKNIFQTGNWYASRSFDNGSTWSYVNPFSIFGSWGFCCDQVTLYDKKRDLQWWLLQGNGLKLAWSRGGRLFTSWCVTSITPGNFGEPSTTEIDYNHLAIGTNDIYVTTNLYPSTGGVKAGVLRIVIQDSFFPNCTGWGGNYFTRTDSFTVVPAQGFTDIAYFGTNWPLNLSVGNHFRLFSWAENSGSYSVYDRTIDAFAFQSRNTANCGSANGVVKNWCQYADSRMTNGYLAKGVLGFYFDSNPCCGIPNPFVRRVYFRESDKVYTGYSNFWCSTCAIAYMDMEPNVDGHIAGAWSWGGGTGTNTYYPGTGYLLDDDISPAQPWGYSFYLWGSGNTCTYGGLYRWGDYNTVRAYDPAGDAFVAAGWRMTGNCGSSGAVSEPHNIIFGRGRDQFSYDRWKSY